MKYVTSTVVKLGLLGAAVLATGTAAALGNPSGTYVVSPTNLIPDCVNPGNSITCEINYVTEFFNSGAVVGLNPNGNPYNDTYYDGVDLICSENSRQIMPWRGPYNNGTSNSGGVNWWYCGPGASPVKAFGAVCDTTLTSNCNINIPF